MGVCDALLVNEEHPADRFRFWLLTHGSYQGERFWRTAVLRECLPSGEALEFAAGEILGGLPPPSKKDDAP
jgi:hypothetical protein